MRRSGRLAAIDIRSIFGGHSMNISFRRNSLLLGP